jgi:hypothetical protein
MEIQEKSLNTTERAFNVLSKELPAIKQSENKSSMPSISYMRDVIEELETAKLDT